MKADATIILSLIPTFINAFSALPVTTTTTTNTEKASRNNGRKVKEKVPLKGIQASQFRHPFDRDLTNFFLPMHHLAILPKLQSHNHYLS